MTIRVHGHVHQGRLELDQPLGLPDGEAVEVLVQSVDATDEEAWRTMSMNRLEQEWDNPEDAVYDNWRSLYGV
jgi:hypothetical protein